MENDSDLMTNKDIHGWTYDQVVGNPYDRTSLKYQYRKGDRFLTAKTVGDILTDIKVKENIEPEVRKPDSKRPPTPNWYINFIWYFRCNRIYSFEFQ